jgi:hypothetical protein
MTGSILIDLHFLPSLEYFCALNDFNEIIIERHERFVKQSYRNRCYILTSQRVQMLTVPVADRHAGMLFRDVRVDQSGRWSVHLLRTIMSAYRNAPFYEHYAEDLEALLSRKHTFLYDLNMDALSFCLKSLHWKKKIVETSGYAEQIVEVLDARSLIYSRESFTTRNFYSSVPYYQLFGTSFSPNLSLIDLLFCKGPQSGEILVVSKGNRLNK